MALQRSRSLIHVISKDRNTISLVVHPFKAEAIIKILIKKNQDAHKKATIKKKKTQTAKSRIGRYGRQTFLKN